MAFLQLIVITIVAQRFLHYQERVRGGVAV